MDLQPVCSGAVNRLVGHSVLAFQPSSILMTVVIVTIGRGGRRCGGMDGATGRGVPRRARRPVCPGDPRHAPGRQCHVVLAPRGAAHVLASVASLVAGHGCPPAATRSRSRDGQSCWRRVSAAPLFIAFTSMPGLIRASVTAGCGGRRSSWYRHRRWPSRPFFVVLAVRTAAADGVSDGVGAADHHGVGARDRPLESRCARRRVVVATPGNRLLGVRHSPSAVDI